MITKADFIDWKTHPVTKEVFASLHERIFQLQEELGGSAGIDTRMDAMKVGAIQACKDLLEMSLDGEERSE